MNVWESCVVGPSLVGQDLSDRFGLVHFLRYNWQSAPTGESKEAADEMPCHA